MNLKLLAEYTAANNAVSKKAAEALLRDAFEMIKDCVAQGEVVVIADFGKFVSQVRPAREGRNPKTGETITIPEKVVVKFKPAKAFRDDAND